MKVRGWLLDKACAEILFLFRMLGCTHRCA
jgi:hypothetical protein